MEEIIQGERFSVEGVEPGEDAEAEGDAAAETAGDRHTAGNFPAERMAPEAAGLEEPPGRLIRHGVGRSRLIRGEPHQIVEVESQPEAIKAGPEVRSCSGDADHDLGGLGGKRHGRRDRAVGARN